MRSQLKVDVCGVKTASGGIAASINRKLAVDACQTRRSTVAGQRAVTYRGEKVTYNAEEVTHA